MRSEHHTARPHRRLASLADLALLPPAAFAVHQLRYVLAYGGHASVMLARTGHSYLHSLAPWLVALLALAAGALLRALGRAARGQTTAPRYTLSLGGLWLACSATLVAIFCAQELLEGFLATGHPGGLAGIFGYGGWWAVPVALCVGLVLAAWYHGARWAVSEVARRWGAAVPRRRPVPARLPRPPLALLVAVPAPLVAGWSGRGPPRRR